MAFSNFQATGSLQRPSVTTKVNHLKPSLSTTLKTPLWRELKQLSMRLDVSNTVKNVSKSLLDVFVGTVFQFVDQPLLPSQSNFAPVDEIGDLVKIMEIEGEMPADFPEGVYIRNGPNPPFGGLKSTVSLFGRSSYAWIEGEGMVHAMYFSKDKERNWNVSYKNRYVESKTFKQEKKLSKPSFLPALEGDSPAILAAYLLNLLRFGEVNKHISNTSVIGHSGKFYATSENHIPQELDIFTLETTGAWDVNGSWGRPFTSHPKTAPGTGELVIMGVDAIKPFYVLGIISADGEKLVHEVDLKFKRSSLSHDIGITQKYNVILDVPLVVDINRLLKGGPLMKFEKDSYARIGVMPRYGDADSVQWFDVENHSTFHILNCFEDENEVVVRGFKALQSIIPGPDFGSNKFDWFSRGFKPIIPSEADQNRSIEDGYLFARCHEWRLNIKTGEVKERYLTGTKFSMDFPVINEEFHGIRNKYGYTQVIDSLASSNCGKRTKSLLNIIHLMIVISSFSLRNLDEDGLVKVEYHNFDENTFCSGAVFVPKDGSSEEDDGWVVSFVHNEETNISQVHIIDAKKFGTEAITKITMPQRVPYGFHGTFFSLPKS
ncbi:hypothetical protein GIB67_005879 [Kingdonia uniflora]|uniref:Uncharacterized protein n=1 Tax=Kingdonia uniflora TaxID=39325 RepID=A0A7J7MBF1_9MAGN|nr:hypothetical protein GIB67_005879 [Kingdonia uniflora]